MLLYVRVDDRIMITYAISIIIMTFTIEILSDAHIIVKYFVMLSVHS